MSPDPDIVKARLSGTNIARLADKIAALDGWSVLDRSEPVPNKRDPGERVYLTVLRGYPPVVQLHAWLAANGWAKGTDGPAGAIWVKDGSGAGVPHDDSDEAFTAGALRLIAAAEGLTTGELVALIVKAAR